MGNKRQPGPLARVLKPASSLVQAVRTGLQALRSGDLRYIDRRVKQQFADSLNLDVALKAQYANDPRWDYLLGHAPSEKVVGLEIHPARGGGEVNKVIAKKRAALKQLRKHLVAEQRVAQWCWAASGETDLSPTDRRHKLLNQAGIIFVGRRLRPKHLSPG